MGRNASTDRNLYVNAITYNGTNTNQSAALMGGGPKTFAISGGTTPAVSETAITARFRNSHAGWQLHGRQ